jgi:hypothetical protein
VRPSLLLLALGSACATTQALPDEPKSTSQPGGVGLRSGAEVSQALERAQAAYLKGNWGDAVVEANKVMEGVATPEEYYQAVKVLGLASCNRKDARPVAFAWTRLQPQDRETLRAACEQSGLGIRDDGRVEPQSSR